MHTIHDDATMYATLSAYTGHSVRYLRIRAIVRASWPVALLTALYAFALTK